MRLGHGCLLAVCAGVLLGRPAYSQQTTAPDERNMFQRLYETVLGAPEAVTLDVPDCLVTLQGGIPLIEANLTEGIQSGHKWAVLITSAHDKMSLPAAQAYYEAVQQMCSPEAVLEAVTLERPSDAFDDASEAGTVLDPMAFHDWTFAHLSFDGEVGMIWRWWIWKVPTIVFITAPSHESKPYDVRFWKVAFHLPNKDRIMEVIGSDLWERLSQWESNISPGGSLDQVTLYLAHFFGLFYTVLDPIPNWLLTVIGSTLGSLLLSYLHQGDSRPAAGRTTSQPQAK